MNSAELKDKIAPQMVAAMAKSRRYVIFSVFILSAILTPPDVISQVLLALPMVLLFEGGLLVARVIERRE